MNFKLTHISSLQLFQLMRFGTFILIGIVFTKTGVSTEAIGEYEQFLFLAGGVSFFWLNGLIRGLLPISNEVEGNEGSPIFNAFLLISLFTAIVVLLLALAGSFIGQTFLGEGGIPYLPILLAYLFFSVPANLVEYFFLLRKQHQRIVYYGAISFAVLFVLVAIPALLGMEIKYALFGLLVIAFLRYCFLFFLLFRKGEYQFSANFMREHWTLSAPLIFSALLSGSAQYVDGLIITSRFDEATFAVFRYGARELPLVILLANAFSNAMLPEFSNRNDISSTLAKIKRESLRLANYLFPLSALLMALSHWLFPVVFNHDFAESATIFNIYLLLILSRLLFPQTLLIGLKRTTLIARASFMELALNVALSLWFVQLWGIAGVAYATVIAYVFEKLFLMLMVYGQLKIPVTKYQNIFRHLIYSLLLLIVFYYIEFVIY